MELLAYWKIVRKHLLLVLGLVLVAVVSAGYYTLRQPPQYAATTTLFLSPATTGPVLVYQTQQVQSLANTFTEFMRTQSFANRVAPALSSPRDDDAIIRAISTKWVRDTQFYQVTATLPDPAQAQVLANTAAEVLINENIARQQAQRRQSDTQNDPGAEAKRQQLTELQKTLEDQAGAYRERVVALQAQITQLERQPRTDDLDKRILALREELIKNQSLWVDLLSSQSRVATSMLGTAATSVDTAVVVDVAQTPVKPVPSKLPQYVLLALVASLGLGVGLAFLLEYLRTSIKTPEEMEAVYGQSSLGIIGQVDASASADAPAPHLIAFHAPYSGAAEAFRALRTHIQFANLAQPPRSVLVTSASPNEGKTFVAANLAASLAYAGYRVILVDADLRRPSLDRLLDAPREPGFTNLLLTPEADLDPFLQPTAQDSLRLLTAGTLPPNPAELLGSPAAVRVMARLAAAADIVVYDSPPAATVVDPIVLASRVDGVIQVVQAGVARPEMILKAKSGLEKVGAHILGPVLNQVKVADLGYYGYGYHYGPDPSHNGNGNGNGGKHSPNGHSRNGHAKVVEPTVDKMKHHE